MTSATPSGQVEFLARLVERKGRLSIGQLIEEEKIFDGIPPLIEEELAAYFARNPELVEEWLTYSLDKRSSDGWYLERDHHGGKVGFFDSAEGRTRQCRFSRLSAACANFVVKELQSIAKRREDVDLGGEG